MPPLPNREVLEAMKRIELQKLCKGYGVRANLKTDALIDLLFEAARPPASRPVPASPQRLVSTRISSYTGTRSRGRSGTSIMIHDSDDEDREEELGGEEPGSTVPELQEPEPTPIPAPRTRKAKDMQTRLGVGRPVAAGGSGARAITKSSSVSKGKRGKSKSMKVVEATIPEESEEIPVAVSLMTIDPPDSGLFPTDPGGEPPQVPNAFAAGPSDIGQNVTDALRPLQEQIQSLKSQLEPMQTLKMDVEQLTTRLGDVDELRRKVHTLTTELADLHAQITKVSTLDAEMKLLKETVSTSLRADERAKARNPFIARFNSPPTRKVSTLGPPEPGTSRSDLTGSPTDNNAPTSNIIQPHPGIAPTALGKRHRDSITSDITGVIEEGQQDEFSQEELASRVVRHTKKRAKLSLGPNKTVFDQADEALSAEANDPPQTAALEEEEEESVLVPRVPSFTVFSELDEPSESYVDPPPPTIHLPEFFAPPSPLASSRPNTSTAQASENQNPFTFSFLATSSTSTNPVYAPMMPSFPYPEAPQSPSPVGSNAATGFARHPGERRRADLDLFQSFVNPRRPGSAATSGSSLQDAPGGFVNPAALTRPSSRPPEREVASSDMTVTGLGVAMVSEQAATTMKTMYGTELAGDTRFGDFGAEGVANDYWASKGY